MRAFLLFWFVILNLAVACSPVGRVRRAIKHSPVFDRHFTGFALYDPLNGKMLHAQNADKYFTPASNTKLFTFYTSLKILGDSVPALQYLVRNDTLFFRGMGDPSFLHPDLKNTNAYHFLKGRPEKLVYVLESFPIRYFGPGWSWDDYNDYYSPEKAALPLYGNIVRFWRNSSGILSVQPSYFRSGVTLGQPGARTEAIFVREPESNQFVYYQGDTMKPFIQDVPFRYSPKLAVRLLADTLKREVGLVKSMPLRNAITLYSLSTDSLYKRLMQESDNFIAEQLLLMCSAVLFDSLNTESAIQYAKQHLLADLPDAPIWVDGSGLSRYNLFTPRSLVALLQKIYEVVPQDRLFSILAAGGRAGTLKNWYSANQPFVFAKTGSLSHVYCLSGYVVTTKGKTLLFSFMHNNYTVPINDIRREMNKVLRLAAGRKIEG